MEHTVVKGASLTGNKKNLNIEVLRIVSMVMIVTLHVLGKGNILNNPQMSDSNYFLAWGLESLSYVAVNCYVLISGYFLIASEFKIKKIIQIWIQVLFYSYIIFGILSLLGVNYSYDLKTLLRIIFPVLDKHYWFATTYLALYLLFPFLNILIKALDKKGMERLLLISLGLFSVWPTLMPFSRTVEAGGGTGIIWFICLYMVAAYIRLYYTDSIKRHIYLYSYLGASLLLLLSKIIIEAATIKFLGKSIGSQAFFQYNSILVFFASVSLFLYFRSITVSWGSINHIILILSGCTFGVYLIHDNIMLSKLLWETFIKADRFVSTPILIPYLFLSVILVYGLCTFIEYLRQQLFRWITGKWNKKAAD